MLDLADVAGASSRAERNAALPPWLRDGYDAAWRDIAPLAIADLARAEDPLLGRSALGVLAMAHELRSASEILRDFTDDELAEMIQQYRG